MRYCYLGPSERSKKQDIREGSLLGRHHRIQLPYTRGLLQGLRHPWQKETWDTELKGLEDVWKR